MGTTRKVHRHADGECAFSAKVARVKCVSFTKRKRRGIPVQVEHKSTATSYGSLRKIGSIDGLRQVELTRFAVTN